MIDDPHVEAMRNCARAALEMTASGASGEAAFQQRIREAIQGATAGKATLTDLISLANAALVVSDMIGNDTMLEPWHRERSKWFRENARELLGQAMRIAGAIENRPPGPVN